MKRQRSLIPNHSNICMCIAVASVLACGRGASSSKKEFSAGTPSTASTTEAGPIYTLSPQKRLYFKNPGLDSDKDGYTDLHEYLTGYSPNHNNIYPKETLGPKKPILPHLGESIEVRFTKEMAALVRKLNYNPARIYNWVHNHIEYEPYYWSRKGALVTYQTKRGNEWDQTSLLITLMRLSGVPARYRRAGFRNWVSPSQRDRAGIYPGVYAEVWVSNGFYRSGSGIGLAPADAGLWVPLAPWVKETHVAFEGFDIFMDAETQQPKVPEALSTLLEDYRSKPRTLTTVEYLKSRIKTYIKGAGLPMDSLNSLPKKEHIVTRRSRLLPRSLPGARTWQNWSDYWGTSHPSVGRVERSDEVHVSERSWFDFLLVRDGDKKKLLEYRAYLPEISGRSFVLDCGITSNNATGSSPRLRIDDHIVARATESLTLGATATLQYKSPEENAYQARWNHPLTHLEVGSIVAIGLDALSHNKSVSRRHENKLRVASIAAVANSALAPRADFLGAFGTLLAGQYLDRFRSDAEQVRALLHTEQGFGSRSTTVFMVSNVLTGASDNTSISFDSESPFLIVPRFRVHAMGGSWHLWKNKHHPWEGTPHLVDWESDFFQFHKDLIHYNGSFQESEALEDWTFSPAMSTIAGLFQAKREDIEIVTLTRANIDGQGRLFYRTGPGHTPVYFDQDQSDASLSNRVSSIIKELKQSHVLSVILPVKKLSSADGRKHFVLLTQSKKGNWYWLGTDNGGSGSDVVSTDAGIDRHVGSSAVPIPLSSFSGGSQGSDTTRFPLKGKDVWLMSESAQVNQKLDPQGTGTVTIVGDHPAVLQVGDHNGMHTTPIGAAQEGLVTKSAWQIVFTVKNRQIVSVSTSRLPLSPELSIEGSMVDVRFNQSAGPPKVTAQGQSPVTVPPEAFADSNKVVRDDLIVTEASSEHVSFEPPPNSNLAEAVVESVGSDERVHNAPPPEHVGAQPELAGDPVNLISGEFYVDERPDITIRSRGPDLSIKRTYRSRLVYDGLFGYGWAWNHSESLLFEQDGAKTHVIYYDADRTPYRLVDDGAGAYTYPPGVLFRLRRQGDVYVMRYRDGSTAKFMARGGQLLQKTDPNGNSLRFGYNLKGRLARIRSASGEHLAFSYGSQGKVIRITDFTGRSVHYAYDGQDLITYTNLLGHPTQYQYLSGQENPLNNHNMSQYTLPTGDWLKIRYFKNDRVSFHVNRQGGRFHFLYSPINRYAETWDESGYRQKVFWNARNDIIRRENADGSVQTQKYDDFHNLMVQIDENGYQTLFEYEPTTTPGRRRNLTQIKRQITKGGPLVTQMKWAYDAKNRVTKRVDNLGYPTQFSYDAKGNLTESLRDLSLAPVSVNQGERFILEEGRPVKVPGNPKRVVRQIKRNYFYDTYGNLTKKTNTADLNTQFTTIEYDDTGRLPLRETTGGHTTLFVYDWLGRLVSKTDPAGNRTQFGYNWNDQRTLVVDSEGAQTRTNFRKDGSIKTRIDPDGGVWKFEYYTARDIVAGAKLKARISPSGRTERFAYDPSGRLTLSIDAKGHRVEHTLDAMGRSTSTTDPLGGTEYRDFDGVGQLIAQTNAAGAQTVYNYDGLGRLTRQINAHSTATSHNYFDPLEPTRPHRNIVDSTGKLIHRRRIKITKVHELVERREWDSRGLLVLESTHHSSEPQLKRIRRYFYDDRGRQTKEIGPTGTVKWARYDGNNNVDLVVMTEPGGNVLSHRAFAYDALRRMTKETDALGNTTRYEYDGSGRMTAKTDALSRRTEWRHDSMGRLIEKIDANGHSRTFTYNQDGELSASIDPIGNRRGILYDQNGNVSAQIDARGEHWRSYYDAMNRKITSEDPAGDATYYDYDLASNLTAISDENGLLQGLAYDNLGRLTQSIEANGLKTKTQYSPNGRTTTKTAPMGTTTISTHNVFGEISEVTTPRGETLSFLYDKLGRLTSVPQGSGAAPIGHTYHVFGKPKSTTLPGGVAIERTHDALGRLTAVTVAKKVVQEFEYDAVSRLTLAIDRTDGDTPHELRLEYDDLDRVTAEIQDGEHVRIGYDAVGHVTSIKYPDAIDTEGLQLSLEFGAGDLLKTVHDQHGHIASFEANRVGRVFQETLGGSPAIQTSIQYAASGRQTRREVGVKTGTLLNRLMTQQIRYSASGSIESEELQSNTSDSVPIAGLRGYDYDDLNRLTSQDDGRDGSTERYWAYDKSGNRTETNESGTVKTTAYTPQDHIMQTNVGYDARGNLTRHGNTTYTYDWANRLVQVTRPTTTIRYGYDALSRRVLRTQVDKGQEEKTTKFIYHGGRVIQERSYSGEIERSFVYGTYIDDLLMMERSGKRYFYVKDHRFSPIALVRADGSVAEYYQYQAFGQMRVFSGAPLSSANKSPLGNPYGFTGRRWDAEAGLWHYRNRDYKSTLGRFLQRDPAGFVDGVNLYTYVHNRPLDALDPSGLTARPLNDASPDFSGPQGRDLYKNRHVAWHPGDSSFNPVNAALAAKASAIAYNSPLKIIQGTEALGFEKVRPIETTWTDGQAFTAYDPKTNAALVAFRGTASAVDLAIDLAGPVVDADPLFGEGKVHAGFLTQFLSLVDQVEENLASYDQLSSDPVKVVVAGHSLGGANAMLFTAHRLHRKNPVVSTYTVGQPPVGDETLLAGIKQNLEDYGRGLFRTVHGLDLIPRVNLAAPWLTHGEAGHEIYIDRNGVSQFDPSTFSKRIDVLHQALDPVRALRSFFLLGDHSKSSYEALQRATKRRINGLPQAN